MKLTLPVFLVVSRTRRRQSRHAAMIAVFVSALVCPLVGRSITIDITNLDDAFAPFGAFAAISGNDPTSSPGRVLEILGGSSGAPLQARGSESNTNSIAIGTI